MLIEKGKRLMSVLEYAHTLVPFESADDASMINHYGSVSDLGMDLLMPIKLSADRYRFMPGPEFSPRLYRGQNQFFENCKPKIFRESAQDIDRIYWQAKAIELAVVMECHPATSDLMALQIEGLTFALSIEAIAQHYQYSTGLLDFSRSKDVAMFFATCKCDEKGDNYQPLQSGIAVLYTVNLRELILQRAGSEDFIPIGLEPLPRPEIQRAFAVRFRPNENLNDMPWAHRSVIEISPQLSHRYFEMFAGGERLFPVNPFDDHIAQLRKNRTVPQQAIEFGLSRGLLPAHPDGVLGVRNAMTLAGYAVEERDVKIDPSVIQAAMEEWALRKANYFSRMRIRGTCDHVVLD